MAHKGHFLNQLWLLKLSKKPLLYVIIGFKIKSRMYKKLKGDNEYYNS